jgi:hypothetical protein
MTIKKIRPPALPKLLDRKLYKTGQTRGADDDEIYQNRVLRNSTVLIPYDSYEVCKSPDDARGEYENGFIVLVKPGWYFANTDADEILSESGLSLGKNAVIFYQRRSEWDANPPDSQGWSVAVSRTTDLQGQFVARVSATTAATKVNSGFNTTSSKGAGIRVYEYAASETINESRLQLESLLWMSADAEDAMVELGMTTDGAKARRELVLEKASEAGLLDMKVLKENRLINDAGVTICPLCREEMSPAGFASKVAQAEGREVFDLTVTQVSLFHVDELRVGRLSHKPYNLGWGHHHCNVVVKDAGIANTIDWIRSVLKRNDETVV